MKRCLFLVALLCVSQTALGARNATKIIRGGFGFLFPDHNSFSNPGQFSISYGMALEAGYLQNDDTNGKLLSPTLVYGNGKVGAGVGYSRSGTDLGSSAANSLSLGLGVALLKSRLTLGASYDRSLDSAATSDGNLGATVTLNGPKRMGPSIGLGVRSSINAAGGDSQAALFGVGYSFRSNVSVEGNFRFNDVSDTSNYSAVLAGTFGTQYVYLAGAYEYGASGRSSEVSGRLGFILGRFVDLSALASHVLSTGGSTTYGATLRASF